MGEGSGAAAAIDGARWPTPLVSQDAPRHRYCAPDADIFLSGFAPGTHEVAASVGGRTASTIFDALPADAPRSETPANFVKEPLDLPASTNPFSRRRRVCLLSNTLERHSQNAIFLRVAAALDRTRWTTEWFVPAGEQTRGNGVREALQEAMVPVRYCDVSTVDFRRVREANLGRANDDAAAWVLNDPRCAAALRRCDAHLYANTRDDPDAAALAELAAALGRPGSLRIMELPNLDPPKDAAADAFVAPSAFAAAAVDAGERPVAVIYPAALIDGTATKPPRVGGAFVVAGAGRLAVERSPGLFVRAVAALARDTRVRATRRFPGEPPDDAPFVRAVYYGDGPLRPALQRLATELGAFVEFPGHVGAAASPIVDSRVGVWKRRTQVANLTEKLAAADVFLQPRAAGETFGVANAEAAAAGCVVIAYARPRGIDTSRRRRDSVFAESPRRAVSPSSDAGTRKAARKSPQARTRSSSSPSIRRCTRTPSRRAHQSRGRLQGSPTRDF